MAKTPAGRHATQSQNQPPQKVLRRNVGPHRVPGICISLLGFLVVFSGIMMIAMGQTIESDYTQKIRMGGIIATVLGAAAVTGGFIYQYMVHRDWKKKRLAKQQRRKAQKEIVSSQLKGRSVDYVAEEADPMEGTSGSMVDLHLPGQDFDSISANGLPAMITDEEILAGEECVASGVNYGTPNQVAYGMFHVGAPDIIVHSPEQVIEDDLSDDSSEYRPDDDYLYPAGDDVGNSIEEGYAIGESAEERNKGTRNGRLSSHSMRSIIDSFPSNENGNYFNTESRDDVEYKLKRKTRSFKYDRRTNVAVSAGELPNDTRENEHDTLRRTESEDNTGYHRSGQKSPTGRRKRKVNLEISDMLAQEDYEMNSNQKGQDEVCGKGKCGNGKKAKNSRMANKEAITEPQVTFHNGIDNGVVCDTDFSYHNKLAELADDIIGASSKKKVPFSETVIANDGKHVFLTDNTVTSSSTDLRHSGKLETEGPVDELVDNWDSEVSDEDGTEGKYSTESDIGITTFRDPQGIRAESLDLVGDDPIPQDEAYNDWDSDTELSVPDEPVKLDMGIRRSLPDIDTETCDSRCS